jgi:hypothetical protein
LDPEIELPLIGPERTYERPESGPSNGLRRERGYSLLGLIATSDRKTAGALERTISQPIPLRTDEAIQ